jgi:haloalkane dehalogenase
MSLESKHYSRLHSLCSVLGFLVFSCILAACSDGGSRPDIAFSDRFLELPNGNRVHFYDLGNPKGKPLLLVHGYPTSAYLYRYIIQDLCGDEGSEFRCIAMTHIGFGQSSCPGDGSAVGPLYLADQLQLFVAAMQLEDMALVIHDWGGPIGAAAGMRIAEKLSHLIVLNTALTPPWVGSLDWLMEFSAGYISEPRPLLEKVYPFLIRMVMQHLTTASLSDTALTVYSSPFEGEVGKCRVHATMNLFSKARTDGRLFYEIATSIPLRWTGKPAVFIWGADDPILSIASDPESFARNQALLPQAETRVIEGGNHFLQEDRPDEIAAEIRRFLARGR